MRVLHSFHTYLKTTENWCYNLIANLPDTECVIASKRFEKCNFYNPRFTYLEFPLRPAEPATGGWLEKRYNKFVRSMLRHWYPAYVGRHAGQVDLLHSHFSFVGWEYRKLARQLGVPHVVSFYGFDYEWLPHNEPKWVARYAAMFDEVDLFLCEGNHGMKILQTLGCPEHKLRTARLGVETGRIPFVRRRKSPGELKLVQVASLTPKKGHSFTVRAFLAALSSCPGMTLTLVGGDAEGLKAELLRIIPGELLNTHITFIDRIDFSELHAFMENYHVFIHPSCYSDDRDCEGGAPVVLLDAQATGMPVIATNHCDIPEEVIDGTTGLLSDEKDVASLAASIERFYFMGQEEFATFADNARSHVETQYDVTHNARLVRTIYDELVEHHAGRSTV
ncbi:glycosyltransferase family 4 protein [Trichlorobacter ammonificans]|uniref:Glycosyl transferase group 1 n=1 Tax=Trichlorobacter ammonificans TaxID=2916410 RepID=A0ABM9D7M0_9BACT|nr:glycosyltransferase family 4 protein [Trichlorobacter ammonificans]CAH2030485.1 Glycosyl transferase group 1 [Trichlorobacter ammonificans]